jgi:hypothetical protein
VIARRGLFRSVHGMRAARFISDGPERHISKPEARISGDALSRRDSYICLQGEETMQSRPVRVFLAMCALWLAVALHSPFVDAPATEGLQSAGNMPREHGSRGMVLVFACFSAAVFWLVARTDTTTAVGRRP